MPSKEVYHPSSPAATTEISKTKEVIDPIRKILIANRGLIAVKTITTLERRGIIGVVAFTKEDKNSLPIRRVRELRQKGWQAVKVHSYSDQYHLIERARKTGCDAIFLGYGFLSENSDFVKKCEKAGLKVLAPPSEVMEKSIKDKIVAKATAKSFGINVLEGTENLPTPESTEKAMTELNLKFPVMLKIPDMGGGRGNFVVNNPEDLRKTYETIKKKKPNCKIFMERYVKNAIHIEIQIAADKYGVVKSLGERDCTMQRNHQKLIEESPSVRITKAMRRKMEEDAIKFTKAIGYQGLGTVEFIVDMDTKDKNGDCVYYFNEINARLQVEHGVTEMQTGLDLIDLMIDLREGKRLPKQKRKRFKEHTIEMRLYAEDPNENFLPSPEAIRESHFPENYKNVRIDTGVEKGDKMLKNFDPMFALVIVKRKKREKAIATAVKVLEHSSIKGIATNREFQIDLLNTPEFRKGKATTSFTGEFAKLRAAAKKLKGELSRGKDRIKDEINKSKGGLKRKADIFSRDSPKE